MNEKESKDKWSYDTLATLVLLATGTSIEMLGITQISAVVLSQQQIQDFDEIAMFLPRLATFGADANKHNARVWRSHRIELLLRILNGESKEEIYSAMARTRKTKNDC